MMIEILGHPFSYLSDQKREWKLRRQIADRIEDPEKREFFLNILKFFKAENSLHLNALARILNQGGKIRIVSACCFHATEKRDGLVDCLSDKIITLIADTVEMALDEWRNFVEWDILTFGPGDVEFLDEIGAKETILPYMLNLSKENLEAEFIHQWHLTVDLVLELRKRDIDAVLLTLSSLFSPSENGDLQKEAQQRSYNMYQKLISNTPPKIFDYLGTDEEKIRRCHKESLLYLLMTQKYGNKGFYLGFEVHGGYWRAGELWKWGDKFLPVLWFHPVLCQHWGCWAEIRKEKRLENYKNFLKNIKNKINI